MVEEKDKWAGWPHEQKMSEQKQKPAKKSELINSEEEIASELLLLSKQVQNLFLELDDSQRRTRYKNKDVIFYGTLNIEERSYLAMLLSDVAGFKDKYILEKEGVLEALCCAEFYAELFPAKLHRNLTTAALTERLTLAIRRSDLARSVRADKRLENFQCKIPTKGDDHTGNADPLTISEIFWIIRAVCDSDEVKKRMIRIRRRNLILLTIGFCKQGRVNRASIYDKFRLMKDDYKVPDLELKPESIEQFWALYAIHVVVPPASVPMLVQTRHMKRWKQLGNEKVEQTEVKHIVEGEDAEGDKNTDEKEVTIDTEEEPEAKDDSGDITTEDEEIGELTERMQDIIIDCCKNPWELFFKRLMRKCVLSKHLQFFVKNVHTSGMMTVPSHFRKAYEAFPEFDWMMALEEFPTEQKKLWEALEQLSADPFCTFHKQDCIQLTDFLHLGYLGIKLQERAAGVSSLAGYRGFARYYSQMPKRCLIDRWVNNFRVHLHGTSAKIDNGNRDPTLKYANFQIPDGKGTLGRYAKLGSIPRKNDTELLDPTAKYANFKIPDNKGRSTRPVNRAFHGCGERHGGKYAGSDGDFTQKGNYFGNGKGCSGHQGGNFFWPEGNYSNCGRNRAEKCGRYAELDRDCPFGVPGGDNGDGSRGRGRGLWIGICGDEYLGGYGTPRGDDGLNVKKIGPGGRAYVLSKERGSEYYRGLRDGYLIASGGQARLRPSNDNGIGRGYLVQGPAAGRGQKKTG